MRRFSSEFHGGMECTLKELIMREFPYFIPCKTVISFIPVDDDFEEDFVIISTSGHPAASVTFKDGVVISAHDRLPTGGYFKNEKDAAWFVLKM